MSYLLFVIFLLFFSVFCVLLLIALNRVEKKHVEALSVVYPQRNYTPTSKTKRLLGFVIDVFIFSACEGGLEKIFSTVTTSKFTYFIAFLLLHILYFGVLELKLGQTMGKMILQTKVIHISGEPMLSKHALLRYCCRWIPMDAISFLIGKGWHDSFSATIVIEKKP